MLEKSPSIGVRGEYTADLLLHLGISQEQIAVIGCPSLFTYGEARPMFRRQHELEASSRVALSFTPTVPGMADWLTEATNEFDQAVVIPQQHQRLALMLWGEDSPTKEDQRLPIHTEHKLYKHDRMRMFVDAKTWFDYLRTQDFVVGTRIHGTVAGVLAQTPSVLLAHDSRTAELAKYHGIPFRVSERLDRSLSLHSLYEAADLSNFASRQPKTFETYLDFLNSHDLENIFDGKNANPSYDEALKQTPFPGPVHTLMRPGWAGREQIISRLSWLRQGAMGDRSRPEYAYKPPVNTRSSRLDLPKIEARVVALENDLAKAQKLARNLQNRLENEPSLKRQLKRLILRTLRRVFRRRTV